MPSLFTIIYVIWILSEILLNRLLRSGTADRQGADNSSLRIIWITMIIVIALATYIAMNYYLPIWSDHATRYAGLVIILGGVVLRLAVVRSLGRAFTVDVTIRAEHRLKTDGFYRYIRHPSYFASLISFIGFGISVNNWLSLLLTTVAVLIVFINRIRVEEAVLVEHFGAEYLDYRKHTKGLIPFLF